MPLKIRIDAEAAKASGLPAEVYHEPDWYHLICNKVFTRTWHCAGSSIAPAEIGASRPFLLLPNCLDEPLLLTRAADRLRCFTNVCTHRGHALVEREDRYASFACPYHGRRFGCDGKMIQMPEYRGVADFPSAADDLVSIPAAELAPLAFVSLDPAEPFDKIIAPVLRRVGFLPFHQFRRDAESDRAYEFDANWILYVDNYLEGLHIPFIHKTLAATMDWNAYRYETFDACNLQIALSAPNEPAFELPAGHPDYEKRVAAFYYWLFPSTMLNFYPWGLSLNIIEPLGPSRTRVRFISYVARPEVRSAGAGGALDLVQREDEAAVTSAQRGMRSRFAPRIRYSPSHESCVHHFHRLLVKYLNI